MQEASYRGRVILLDLNYTLVANSPDKKRGPARTYRQKITEETYREWLIELLEPHTVHLITVRRTWYEQETLRRIAQLLEGWQPDAHHFNPDNISAPEHKRRVLHEVIWPRYGMTADYLALESNERTRAMYIGHGVPVARIRQDQDPWSELPPGVLAAHGEARGPTATALF